ncbi:MAG: hypothetical protein J0G37_11920 [Afipia sp.]|nr:hypothetical protein [Afipia sp.]
MRRLILTLACLTVAVLVLCVAPVAAGELDLTLPEAPQGGTPAPAGSLVHHDQPNCTRWTDDCVICTRDPGGGPPLCSNIGVACQPQAIRCLAPLPPDPAPPAK